MSVNINSLNFDLDLYSYEGEEDLEDLLIHFQHMQTEDKVKSICLPEFEQRVGKISITRSNSYNAVYDDIIVLFLRSKVSILWEIKLFPYEGEIFYSVKKLIIHVIFLWKKYYAKTYLTVSFVLVCKCWKLLLIWC